MTVKWPVISKRFTTSVLNGPFSCFKINTKQSIKAVVRPPTSGLFVWGMNCSSELRKFQISLPLCKNCFGNGPRIQNSAIILSFSSVCSSKFWLF